MTRSCKRGLVTFDHPEGRECGLDVRHGGLNTPDGRVREAAAESSGLEQGLHRAKCRVSIRLGVNGVSNAKKYVDMIY